MKMVAMYYMQTTSDVPAFIGLFSSPEAAGKYLVNRNKSKYYTRSYTVDALIS